MPARISFEPAARSAPADFPPRCVVAARRAPHHHAVALEVKHRVVSAHAAHRLSEPRHHAKKQAGCCRLSAHVRCRELLGVIGNHARLPVPPVGLFTRTLSTSTTLRSRVELRNIKRCATAGLAVTSLGRPGGYGRITKPQYSALCSVRAKPLTAGGCGAVTRRASTRPLWLWRESYPSRSRLFMTNPILAGRSPSRRMK
jgi:hypothetical protein